MEFSCEEHNHFMHGLEFSNGCDELWGKDRID